MVLATVVVKSTLTPAVALSEAEAVRVGASESTPLNETAVRRAAPVVSADIVITTSAVVADGLPKYHTLKVPPTVKTLVRDSVPLKVTEDMLSADSSEMQAAIPLF
jgi:hypothetical protein